MIMPVFPLTDYAQLKLSKDESPQKITEDFSRVPSPFLFPCANGF
jgi:hypothetical protein